MIHIDERPPQYALEQFASQVEHVEPETLRFISEGFSGTESPDFYAGIVAGLRVAFQYASLQDGRGFIGALLAISAKEALIQR